MNLAERHAPPRAADRGFGTESATTDWPSAWDRFEVDHFHLYAHVSSPRAILVNWRSDEPLTPALHMAYANVLRRGAIQWIENATPRTIVGEVDAFSCLKPTGAWPVPVAYQTASVLSPHHFVPFDLIRRILHATFASSARPRAQAATALLDRIRAFQALPADWDGEGTVLVSTDTIAAAARVIDAAEAGGLSLPQASPSSEGDVGLNWYSGRDVFEVTLAPDMHAFWASRMGDRVVPGKIVAVDSSEFPSVLVEKLREFYSGSTGVPLRE